MLWTVFPVVPDVNLRGCPELYQKILRKILQKIYEALPVVSKYRSKYSQYSTTFFEMNRGLEENRSRISFEGSLKKSSGILSQNRNKIRNLSKTDNGLYYYRLFNLTNFLKEF